MPFADGTMLIACSCGNIAEGKHGERWAFEYDAAGLVRTTPSIDWPGHFHTGNPSPFIPVTKTMSEFIRPAP